MDTAAGTHPLLPPGLRVFERGWLSSNNVLTFDDEHQASLIDSGYCSHAAQTEALVTHGLAGRSLVRIFNTHLHSDHCGGNAQLARRFGAAIAIPPGLADAVAEWDEDRLAYAATGQQCERFSFDSLLVPDSELRLGQLDWRVIAAPGHDPHSVMFWCADERILISADVLWQHGFGVIFPELEGDSGFAEQAAMLDLIESLSPRLVIPGHGALFVDVPAALARARQRLAALAEDPARNARNGARALIKFHLLAVRRTGLAELIAHLAAARYFPLINERYFGLVFEDFVDRIVRDLVASGAAVLHEGVLSNSDS